MKKLTFILVNSDHEEVDALLVIINHLYPELFKIIVCKSTQEAVLKINSNMLVMPDFIFIALRNDETHDGTLAIIIENNAIPVITLTDKNQFQEYNKLYGHAIITERKFTIESIKIDFDRMLQRIELNKTKKTGIVVAQPVKVVKQLIAAVLYDESDGVKVKLNGNFGCSDSGLVVSIKNKIRGKGSNVSFTDGTSAPSSRFVSQIIKFNTKEDFLPINQSELINIKFIDPDNIFNYKDILMKDGLLYFISGAYGDAFRDKGIKKWEDLKKLPVKKEDPEYIQLIIDFKTE